MTASIQTRLRRAKDRLGWKPPYHEHYRTIRNGADLPYDPSQPPIYALHCAAEDCEAPGCPRTRSGFPDPHPDER